MTPGSYLRLRREAAGRSVDDTVLHGERLAAIEAGAAPTEDELWALRMCVPFSLDVLCMIGRGMPVRLCRTCGCSEDDACVSFDAEPIAGTACYWTEADLCSACPPPPTEALAA